MTDRPAYALLDAGDGRRLDRFGDRVVDRPAPAAVGPADERACWATADLRYDRERGWRAREPALLGPWMLAFDGLRLELRPAAGGQVGLFPEQGPIWRWLTDRVARSSAPPGPGRPARILSLFAYTGAATLAAARAGAAVAHVDGSRPAVAWARRNAAASGLDGRPIRWLVDDAAAFVLREIRREARYDGIVLDPPSYGHGGGRGRGPAWRIADDLPDLLAGCARLLDPAAPFIALSAHSPEHGAGRLGDLLADGLSVSRAAVSAADLDLRAETGATLPLGAYATWSG